ncbi:extracellular solute-binding protein [Subtercola endophyticus]|uniref:extracellular solute-binding protein n=1 Tax=Subtercola endophyticus TaxID=2895559 RepID=UPI001E35C750|nr:extracellular solute-binding protein [Subtercola endophyticus]UFS60670.1 extracellular solute-binding protein [Subtercola endophyticus]
MARSARRSAMALAASAVALGLLLSGCAGSASSAPAATTSQADIDKAMTTPTTITFWTSNKLQDEVDLFEKKYPAITVNLVDSGSGTDYYTKLRSAIKAGNGAPDVAQIEYHHMPSFILQGSLDDLTPYGAADVKDKFATFAWNQVATDKGIYGIPQDTGPLGLLYRNDIFAASNIKAPTTWDEFATDAAIIHAANPSQYIANISPSNASATMGLFWQAGAQPFSYDGDKTVSINLDSPEMVKVAEYWQKLVQAGTVSTDPDFTDQWYQGLASGRYASWVSAAWGPLFLQGTAADTAGKWTASTLPQWAAGENKSGSVGGSANAVISTTANPIPSAVFAEFLNSDPESTLTMGTKQFLFPAAKATLANPAFTDQPVEFFGGQKINELFSQISPTVNPDFQWLPFMDPVFDSYNATFGKALTDKTSLTDALTEWQKQVVDYATSQGFTVK